MDIFSLGHESYIINHENTFMIVDPILEVSFGSDKKNKFIIKPTRKINYSLLPKINCIVLTTEHLQHFHPLSIKKLYIMHRELHGDQEIKVFVPSLFPASAEKIINEIGFKLIRLQPDTHNYIGDLDIRFYIPQSDMNVPFWDSRVASLYLSNGRDALFIQSDTKISRGFR